MSKKGNRQFGRQGILLTKKKNKKNKSKVKIVDIERRNFHISLPQQLYVTKLVIAYQ